MNTLRLAIDVESGDFGARVFLAGIAAARKLTSQPFVPLLCGNRQRIETVILESDIHSQLIPYEIIECVDFVDPGEQRANVWKKQKNAAIIKCIELQQDRLVDASISAGDTAILLGAALFILGRTAGTLRPALGAFLPTIRKKPILLLDVGANLICRPEHLISFAEMGNRYASRFLGLQSPVVTLLGIGREVVKGTRGLTETDTVLKNSTLNYRGFIEGNDILTGESDVVVCDGFCGNVVLKAFESFHALAQTVFGEKVANEQLLKEKILTLDPDTYGAVPFLGINGAVLKAHGGSSSRAIANAVLAAIKAVQHQAVRDVTILKGV